MKFSYKILLAIIIIVVLSLVIYFQFFNKNNKLESEAKKTCQEISTPDDKNMCFAIIRHNEKYCQKLDELPKNVCLAEIKKDSSYCQNIIDKGSKQFCYQNLVDQLSNPQICGELTDQEQKSACYVHFVSTNFFLGKNDLLDSKYCEKIIANSPEKSLCLALTKNDKNSCNSGQLECRAFLEKDLNLCEKMSSETDNSECYYAIAVTSNNQSICDKILEGEKKDQCFRDLGKLNTDLNICKKIGSQELKNQCFLNIARIKASER